jgi:hypothetical protein
MVESPKGTKFRVEVKTQSTVNFWRYRRREVSGDLFYIFVYLNKVGQNPKFHVLTSKQAMDEWQQYYDKHKKPSSQPTDYGWGALYSSIAKYENNWKKLPE